MSYFEKQDIKKLNAQRMKVIGLQTPEGQKARDEVKEILLRGTENKTPQELEDRKQLIAKTLKNVILQTPEGEQIRSNLGKLLDNKELEYIDQRDAKEHADKMKIHCAKKKIKDAAYQRTWSYKMKIALFWLIVIAINILIIYFGIIDISMDSTILLGWRIVWPIFSAMAVGAFNYVAYKFYKGDPKSDSCYEYYPKAATVSPK